MGGKPIDKMAFVTHHELFKYSHMPFGLKHTPAAFQREINVFFVSVKWQQALVQTDDTILSRRRSRIT